MTSFLTLLGLTRTVFTAPGYGILTDLVTGWISAPGRRTITNIITVADPAGRRAHDAYHRFLRDGAWSMNRLWQTLDTHLINTFAPTGVIELACDDTLFHHEGPTVEGAGVFRDAVRSTIRRIVYARGLNLVVITLKINPPWGGCPIAVPVNVRVHKKHDETTTIGHAAAMMTELSGWFPDRRFHLCADGAYATLAGANLPRTETTSRMRRDAALYEPAPPPTGKRGRPRTRGDRLPTPTAFSKDVPAEDWDTIEADSRGTIIERQIHVEDVLWYRVNKTDQVRLVIVRDPQGVEPDDYFFTTDLTASGADILSRYSARWAIEVSFRDVKQDLGGQDPQSRKRQGPERAAALSLWLHAATWCWYIQAHPKGRTWIVRPWYRSKATPSFLDALAALRRAMWSHRISEASRSEPETAQISQTLIDTLAYAA